MQLLKVFLNFNGNAYQSINSHSVFGAIALVIGGTILINKGTKNE